RRLARGIDAPSAAWFGAPQRPARRTHFPQGRGSSRGEARSRSAGFATTHRRTAVRMTSEIIFLGAQDVRSLLSIEDCIHAVEQAFRLYGDGKARGPQVLGMHSGEGGFHIKAGLLDLEAQYFAAKINGNFPLNPERFGLPTIQGILVLCDAEKGTPLAIMDSRDVTSLRTTAATA